MIYLILGIICYLAIGIGAVRLGARYAPSLMMDDQGSYAYVIFLWPTLIFGWFYFYDFVTYLAGYKGN